MRKEVKEGRRVECTIHTNNAAHTERKKKYFSAPSLSNEQLSPFRLFLHTTTTRNFIPGIKMRLCQNIFGCLAGRTMNRVKLRSIRKSRRSDVYPSKNILLLLRGKQKSTRLFFPSKTRSTCKLFVEG